LTASSAGAGNVSSDEASFFDEAMSFDEALGAMKPTEAARPA
jgi:hypothetical protein